MLDDFQMITHQLSTKLDEAHIYPIGDLHIGSKEFNENAFLAWRDMVQNDPKGYVVIVGDMMNMGLKSSKSNIYEEALHPAEQKEACYRYLFPIKDKILAGCSGNHEYRGVREAGMNPLYDVFCWLHKEPLYRENACFVKVTLGNNDHGKPISYGLVLTHGKSKLIDEKWTYSVDGCDVFVSGHTHDSLHKPLGKITMDMRNEVVRTVGFHQIVVEPFQSYGGYAMRGKYLPSCLSGFQIIRFSGKTKRVGYAYD